MAQISTSEFRGGVKLEIDNQPYVIVSNEFVKPGKGQAFNRVRLKNLLNNKVLERTFKSGDKFELADVLETQMRMLYIDADGAVFMHDDTFEQITIPMESIGSNDQWLKEDTVYGILIYKGQPVSIEPPTFMDLEITQTDPGARGDTASGRVLKPATLETGAKVQIPIFIEQGERVRIDTRTGEYTSRSD
ncbi:MAG: elongation factor P [Chlamydiota bacterium]|nr:elongation factor P [Chlamydiota bacterium]